MLINRRCSNLDKNGRTMDIPHDHHSIPMSLSPIQRIPVEIVLLVFTYATSPQRDSFRVDFPIEITVLYISQTCSLWRNISLALPSLWANIHIAIDVVQSESYYNAVVTYLDLLLRRSGESPLTIAIRDLDIDYSVPGPASSSSSSSTYPDYNSISASRKTRKHALRTIFVLSHRWFSITLVGNIRYACACASLIKGLPLLQRLDISSSELYLFQSAVSVGTVTEHANDFGSSSDRISTVGDVGNIRSLRVKCIISDPPRASPSLSRLTELFYDGKGRMQMQLGALYSLVRNCAGTLERLYCRFAITNVNLKGPARSSLSLSCSIYSSSNPGGHDLASNSASWSCQQVFSHVVGGDPGIHLPQLTTLDISYTRSQFVDHAWGKEDTNDDTDDERRVRKLIASLSLFTKAVPREGHGPLEYCVDDDIGIYFGL